MSASKNPIYGVVIIEYKNFLKITNRYDTQLQMDNQYLNLNGE